MIFFRYLFFLFVAVIFPSLVMLGIGILLSNTERYHMLGIRLIAMCMFVSGRFISNRCRHRGNCSGIKCGNWNCEMYSCSGSLK